MREFQLLMAAALCCVLTFAHQHRSDLHYGDARLVEYINSLNTTWKAGYNRRFHHVDHHVIRGMLGVRHDPSRSRRTYKLGKTRLLDIDIPDSFDSRDQWGHLCPSLYEVRDQSSCGSCWAFGATEAMSDRLCISSRGKIQAHLSADDLLSCCSSCGMGLNTLCDGGEPIAAWEYWVNTGIVTGSNYTSHSGCRPYPFPPCEHHNNQTHFKPCQHDLYPTPQCEHKCLDTYKKSYEKDKYYGLTHRKISCYISHSQGRKAYAIHSSVEAIQKELITHGPIEVAFEVYEDFLLYKSGVYQHHAGRVDGGHAVKLIGWGTDNGTPYWLVVNSWNTDWGDNGLFKILRGHNECGIESEGVAGLPKIVSNRTPKKKVRPDHSSWQIMDDFWSF